MGPSWMGLVPLGETHRAVSAVSSVHLPCEDTDTAICHSGSGSQRPKPTSSAGPYLRTPLRGLRASGTEPYLLDLLWLLCPSGPISFPQLP